MSYLMGDVGILLLHWKLDPSERLAQQLFDAIEANLGHPAREFMWGSPGTMLAALFMFEQTGEPRWEALFLRSCEELWQDWEYAEEFRCHLWTQDLYGHSAKLIGAVHGFAGNVHPLIRGRHLLRPAWRDEWFTRISETLNNTIVNLKTRIICMHYSRKQHWRKHFLVPSPYPRRGLGRGCAPRFKNHASPTGAAISGDIGSGLFSL